MNPPSQAMHEAPNHPQGAAPAPVSTPRPMYWSVRRELWETRSIYLAPLSAAGVFLLGFLISMAHLVTIATNHPMDPAHVIEAPYNMVALVIMATMLLVAIFYSLDALHGERRDRSILFWKSLPVSDVTAVLAKAMIPIVILPLISFAVTVATQWVMLLVNTIMLLGNGEGVKLLWSQVHLFPMSLMLLYHLLAFHGLWYAPIYCWLLLVSAWARRGAFLWAALPVLAMVALERVAFGTSYFASMLKDRFVGTPESAPSAMGNASMEALAHLQLGHFLVSPGLWMGFALSAVFLAAAVRLRQYRGPI